MTDIKDRKNLALNYRKVDPRAEIMLARQLSLSGTCYKKQDPRAEILAARACKQPQESVFDNSEPVGANYKRPDVQSEIRSIKAANNSNTLSSTNEKSDINNNLNSQDQLSYQNGYHHHQSSLQQSQQQTTSPPFSLSPIADISNNQRNSNIEQQLNNGNNNIYHQNSVSPQNSMYKLASSCIDSSPNTEVHNKRNSNLKAVCLYDYNANEDDELSFRAKEHIFDIEQIDEGWWLGRNADGQVGLFPANYVKLMM
ncbi:putative hematopoietic lineage cell specific protein [Schistosoma mansoni]|uniref:putative hematopoietic lineage cell specific protein n=1 Tax=Schistosoma mansoni TaxID=6183 RepID=UPI0001A625F0|nr:putative hematopoietic lineage cell specific protein [Schistosoma mansoni]|eukprot:XP_018652127.1 putative hematopoietic lineage cell specific protein [Schistosoma mansoni]